eukprot:COSAG02_NODE_36995_length_448_cov_0.444126_1_plen_30_part_01
MPAGDAEFTQINSYFTTAFKLIFHHVFKVY